MASHLNRAHAGADGLGLESVGVALTIGRSLMRLGLGRLLPLDLHGKVHDDVGRSPSRETHIGD